MRNLVKCGVWIILGLCVSSLAHGQYYDDAYNQNSPYGYGNSQGRLRVIPTRCRQIRSNITAHLHPRTCNMIPGTLSEFSASR